MQVLHVKTMPSNRYRLLLSDGKSTITGMLATQLHDLVENKSILDFSVIRLTDYITNSNAGTM
jgi:Replication factor-A protein 1, N-terminal domain